MRFKLFDKLSVSLDLLFETTLSDNLLVKVVTFELRDLGLEFCESLFLFLFVVFVAQVFVELVESDTLHYFV